MAQLSPIFFLISLTGFLQLWTNFIIAFVILRYAGLRKEKEYVILLGMAIADGIDGIPSMYAGIYRIFLTLYGNPLATVTPFYCMIVGLQNPMWAWSDTAQSLMMLFVSIDRLLAVAIPLKYYSFTDRYGKRMVGAVFLYCAFSACSAWIRPIAELVSPTPNAFNTTLNPGFYPNALCYTTATLGFVFNEYYTNLRVYAVCGSVVLYVLVVILFGRHLRKFSANRNDFNDRKQRRLTITLSIQCICHIILYIIPTFLISLATPLGISATVVSYLLIFTNTNAIINLFIYLVRQKEFYFAFKKALANQSLPPSIAMWAIHGTTVKTGPRKASSTLTLSKPRPL